MGALLFIPLLALTWAFGLVMVLFGSHFFLGVLESSAASKDEVVMPQEQLTDYFWKGFYLTFLGVIWGAPGLFLAAAAGKSDSIMVASIAIGWFWLLFPVGILSSMSAGSKWVPFWPELFARMAQRLGKVLSFYAISLPVIAALGAGFYIIAVRKVTELPQILLLAPVTAAAFLIYARLLGRIGMVLTFTKGAPDKARKKKPRRTLKKRAIPLPQPEEAPVTPRQPSEMRGIMTPMDGEVTGYDVNFEDKPPEPESPAPRGRPFPDDDDNGQPLSMAAADESAPAERSLSPREAEALKPPPKSELELFDRSDRILKEPHSPFAADSLTFLAQTGPRNAWILMTLGLAFWGVLILGLRALRPA